MRKVVLVPVLAAVALVLAGCSVPSTGVSSSGGAAASAGGSSAAPAANPYDTKYGSFAPLTTTGTSDSLFALPAGAKGGIITASYTGSSNFIVSILDASNQSTIDGPVNTIGNYKGVTTFGMIALGNAGTQVQVKAQGSWSITISPISSAPATKPASGTGDAVFLYNGAATSWSLTNAGTGNFIVNQYGSTIPGIGINEIGAYSGKVPVNAGPSIVVLKSDGNWTIS